MADSYLASEGRSKRLKEMIIAGDKPGIERMKFGEIVYYLRNRKIGGLSQGQAAGIAGIERTEWNRIENGLVRPLPATVVKIAKALDVEPAILLVLAGHKVPGEHCLYDREHFHRMLDEALDQCLSRAEFAIHMDVLWKECEEVLMINGLGELPSKVAARPTYTEILDKALEHLTASEKVQFAMGLVESSPPDVVKASGVDQARFYKMVNDRLEEFRYTPSPYDEDDPF